MAKKARNIGVKVKLPSKECEDKKCPFHGELSLRGRVFTGLVISRDVHRTATVEWNRRVKNLKYERFEKKRKRCRKSSTFTKSQRKKSSLRITDFTYFISLI